MMNEKNLEQPETGASARRPAVQSCECGEEPYVRYDCAGFDVVCQCGRVTESCPQPNEAVKLWKRKYMPNTEISGGAEKGSSDE